MIEALYHRALVPVRGTQYHIPHGAGRLDDFPSINRYHHWKLDVNAFT